MTCQARPLFFFLFPPRVRYFEQRSKQPLTTVDHSDIRGSSMTARLHNRDPSGLPRTKTRVRSVSTCRIELAKDSPFRAPCDLCPQYPTLIPSLTPLACLPMPRLLPSAPDRAPRSLQWPRCRVIEPRYLEVVRAFVVTTAGAAPSYRRTW